MIIDSYFKGFKDMIDPDVLEGGSIQGEQGGVCRIWVNRNKNVLYYANYIEEFLRSFNYLFPDLPARYKGVGESVNIHVINDSNKYVMENRVYIIIAKPINGITFYGMLAQDWKKFCDQYNTYWIPKNRYTKNGAVPARLLRNMAEPQDPELQIKKGLDQWS